MHIFDLLEQTECWILKACWLCITSHRPPAPSSRPSRRPLSRTLRIKQSNKNILLRKHHLDRAVEDDFTVVKSIQRVVPVQKKSGLQMTEMEGGSYAENIFTASNKLKYISNRLPWTLLTDIPTRHKCSMSPQSQAPVDFQWSSSRNSLDDLHRLQPFFLLTAGHRNLCLFNSIHRPPSTSGCCCWRFSLPSDGGLRCYFIRANAMK